MNRRRLRVSLILILSVGAIAGILFLLHTATTEAQNNPSPQTICFVNSGQTACVERPRPSSATTITTEIQALTRWLIAGPTATEKAQGVQSPLPENTQLGFVTADERHVLIGLNLPDEFLRALTDSQVEDINEEFRTTFIPYNFQRMEIDARGSSGGYRLISDFLPKIEIPRKESSPAPSIPTTAAMPTSESGGLSGKTVFVSAGHGWYWYPTSNTYLTQRPPYPTCVATGEGLVEDFNNAEAVNQ